MLKWNLCLIVILIDYEIEVIPHYPKVLKKSSEGGGDRNEKSNAPSIPK